MKKGTEMKKWTERHEYYLSRVILPIENKLKEIMVGQDEIVKRVVQGLFAVGQRDLNAQTGENFWGSGHTLFEGAIGTGKTLLCKLLSKLLAGKNNRVSGIPDALPSDIVGSEIILLTGDSKTVKGPIFCNVILVDEINRFSPKAQTAFIEALAEGTVTLGEETYQLDQPFFLVATMNPIEEVGTYRMQGALRDRFMFKLATRETTPAEKAAIAQRTRKISYKEINPIVNSHVVKEARHFFFDMDNFYVSPAISECCAKLIHAINHPVEYHLFEEEMKLLDGENIFKQKIAMNDRAVLHLEGAAIMEAAWHRRGYVLPADVCNVAADVLRARMMIDEANLHILTERHSSYKTETELCDYLIKELLAKVTLP